MMGGYMKKVVFSENFFLLVLLFSYSSLTQSSDKIQDIPQPELSSEKHEIAARMLLSTHFFENGRGMHTTPGIVESYESMGRFLPKSVTRKLRNDKVEKRWGFSVVDGHRVIGFFKAGSGINRLGIAGCTACHSGKAAGILVPGLGNKNIDAGLIGSDFKKMAVEWAANVNSEERSKEWNDLHTSSLQFAETLRNEKITNLTQGMVPVSIIVSWFYRNQNLMPPSDLSRMAVKVPHLWGYGEKRNVGLFSDGFGEGRLSGWGSLVELVSGQTVDTVEKQQPRYEEFENQLSYLLPPQYPYKIDEAKKAKGRHIFTARCTSCHGDYTRTVQNYPIYQRPKYITLDVVKTDDDRTRFPAEAEWNRLVDSNPLSKYIKRTALRELYGAGYIAPRLEGVWARFPYLHNGSVPSLEALLLEESKRPKAWSLERAGEKERFNEKTVGLTIPNPKSAEEAKLIANGKRGIRSVYYVERVGHSNRGHEFANDLDESQRSDLIEYLKSL